MKLHTRLSSLSPETRTAMNLMTLQMIYWVSWSFGTFQPVYLQSVGMSSSQLGILNAVSSTVAIFAAAFWGVVSDKINSVKKTYVITLILSAVTYILFPLIPLGTRCTILLFIVLASVVNFSKCASPILLDNLTVRNCAVHHLNYGPIRSLGSAAFAVSCCVFVLLIPVIGLKANFWLLGAFTIPCLLIVSRTPDPKVQAAEKKKIRVSELFHSYYYVSLLIFAAILWIALSGELSFLTYLMADRNIPIENLGIMLAIRATMEIPSLLCMARLRRSIKLKYLLMLSSALMAAECILLGTVASTQITFMITVTIFGLGNGLLIGTIPMYVYKLAPDHLKASAHTIYTSVSSVAGIIGNFFGGFAYQAMGGSRFYILLGSGVLTAALFLFLSTALKKNLPNPADEKD